MFLLGLVYLITLAAAALPGPTGWAVLAGLLGMAIFAIASPRNLRLFGYVLFLGLFVFWTMTTALWMYDFGIHRIPDAFKDARLGIMWAALGSVPVVLYWAMLEKNERGLQWPLGVAASIYAVAFVLLVLAFFSLGV